MSSTAALTCLTHGRNTATAWLATAWLATAVLGQVPRPQQITSNTIKQLVSQAIVWNDAFVSVSGCQVPVTSTEEVLDALATAARLMRTQYGDEPPRWARPDERLVEALVRAGRISHDGDEREYVIVPLTTDVPVPVEPAPAPDPVPAPTREPELVPA